ncbi:hypothetical protein [Aeoliella sp.]|uniref:hypothetical protein n=1 Tax=Aeoliella sp. TaxID=2795800 RepID=UPI003CCBC02D
MTDDLGQFDEVFPQSPTGDARPPNSKPLRRRKPAKQQIGFWCANALVTPVAATCCLVISGEGWRTLLGITSMRLHSLPIPGADLLRNYSGFNKLDLAILCSLVLLVAVEMVYVRFFMLLMENGNLTEQRNKNPILFFLLSAIALVIVGGDAGIFYLGLASKAANSWTETPAYVPAVATAVWLACLGAYAAWVADYKCSGTV